MEATTSAQTLALSAVRKACSACSLGELSLPMGLNDNALTKLEQVVEKLGPLHRGDHLFRQGDAIQELYLVRSGYLKTYVISKSGEERVLGFFMSGELLGLDSIPFDRKRSNAEVLDTSIVCRLPFEKLNIISTDVPALQRQLLRLISRELMRAESNSLHNTVDGRIATFLLDWGERLDIRGSSAHHFMLPMSRQDIGNHLKMSPETVSRCFSRFNENGWINLMKREIKITDLPALVALRANIG